MEWGKSSSAQKLMKYGGCDCEVNLVEVSSIVQWFLKKINWYSSLEKRFITLKLHFKLNKIKLKSIWILHSSNENFLISL